MRGNREEESWQRVRVVAAEMGGRKNAIKKTSWRFLR